MLPRGSGLHVGISLVEGLKGIYNEADKQGASDKRKAFK